MRKKREAQSEKSCIETGRLQMEQRGTDEEKLIENNNTLQKDKAVEVEKPKSLQRETT